ncbi:MAG: hypothetical protein H0T97_09240 [Actinobacteria bacterium]|nr:hypothetical protein [Actinomycetota bacterium]
MRLTSSHGRSIRVVVPPSIAELALAMKVELEKLDRLEEALQANRDELTRHEAELERAELERARGIKEAALADKPLPTKDPTRQIRDEIDLAKSRVQGFQDAIEEQTQTAVDVLERDRAKILATAESRRAAAATKLEKTLDAYVAARAVFMAATEDEKCAAGFPREKTNWNADQGSLVFPPVSREQRLATWDAVETALRQDAKVERRLRHERGGRVPALAADAGTSRRRRERELRPARKSPPVRERGMSEQPRDEQGRFAEESGTETMNRRLREFSGRRRVRVVAEQPDGHRATNEALLRAAGKLPRLDDDAAA